MTNDNTVQQEQMNFFEIFLFTCLGYTILTMCTIFFEEDLFRILTFFTPFFWMFLFIGYLLIAAMSLFYIPFQIRKLSWRAFGPIIVNSITFLVVYYFYDAIKDLRIDVQFRINKHRYAQAASWVTESIKNGTINFDGRGDVIYLPAKFQNLADDGKIYVINEYGVVSILFSRGGGMFEYGPSFVYRSDNIAPGFEFYADTQCNKWLSRNWYDCY